MIVYVGDKVHIPLMWVHAVRNLKPCVKFNLYILQMESLKVVVQANQLSKVVMQNAPRLLNESGQSPDPCGANNALSQL
jgi:hypothetical protein